jgi:hypothetical protein
LQIKCPNKERAKKIRHLSKKEREREQRVDEKDHAVESKKRGGKLIYEVSKGKEK